MRDARARDEQARRVELATAVDRAQSVAADIAAIAGRVATRRAALAAGAAWRDRLLEGGAAAAVIAQIERYLHRLRRELEAARGEQLRAEARHRGELDAVGLARERLVLARADREVVDRHFAAWRAERRRLADRRED